MARIKALVDYVRLEAFVEPVQDDVKVVAFVRPRIRAFVEHVEIRVMIEESPYIITWSIWDTGLTEWDVVDGVPQTKWDLGLL